MRRLGIERRKIEDDRSFCCHIDRPLKSLPSRMTSDWWGLYTGQFWDGWRGCADLFRGPSGVLGHGVVCIDPDLRRIKNLARRPRADLRWRREGVQRRGKVLRWNISDVSDLEVGVPIRAEAGKFSHVVVAIVATDEIKNIIGCLQSLNNSIYRNFSVVICENGGRDAFARDVRHITNLREIAPVLKEISVRRIAGLHSVRRRRKITHDY